MLLTPSSGAFVSSFIQFMAKLELDILIYPELGMDKLTMRLAHVRYSPLQLVFWGHPVSQVRGRDVGGMCKWCPHLNRVGALFTLSC